MKQIKEIGSIEINIKNNFFINVCKSSIENYLEFLKHNIETIELYCKGQFSELPEFGESIPPKTLPLQGAEISALKNWDGDFFQIEDQGLTIIVSLFNL